MRRLLGLLYRVIPPVIMIYITAGTIYYVPSIFGLIVPLDRVILLTLPHSITILSIAVILIQVKQYFSSRYLSDFIDLWVGMLYLAGFTWLVYTLYSNILWCPVCYIRKARGEVLTVLTIIAYMVSPIISALIAWKTARSESG